MTFLQPYLLWLLPFAALPIVIHLLNRMRFRTVHWAATRFLFSANRASTRYARLRQLLLLACRVLALLAMVLAVARPLAGGWAGWMLSGSPDVVLILLDRSASMEARDAGTGMTRRDRALREVSAAAAAYGGRTRFVLFENVLRTPEEVADPKLLESLPSTAPTDTAADMPGLYDAAAGWLEHNRVGLAEVWLVSDLQRSNWEPGSPRWKTISARLGALPETVRVRLLAMGGKTAPDTAVTLVNAARQGHGTGPGLDLTFDLQRTDTGRATVPVTLTLDGVRSHLDVEMEGAATRVHHTLPLEAGRDSGFGSIELPPDGNERNNEAYFVYSPPPVLHAAVIGGDEATARCLDAAADPFPNDAKLTCDVMEQPPGKVDWEKYATVAWAAPLPAGDAARELEAYVNAGGAVIFFPTTGADAGGFGGGAWGDERTAGAGETYRVTHWDEQEGPLADAESGVALGVGSLEVTRARGIVSGGEVLAMFGDNTPFLTQRVMGKGRIYFCATLPEKDWSTLADGRVLVPMVQRVLEEGAKRLQAGSYLNAGDEELVENPAGWVSLEPGAPRDVRSEAGVYRNGSRLAAVNRPAEEDDEERMTANEARGLFAPLGISIFEERGAGGGNLQGEIWRALLFAMLVFLVGESVLSLPPRGAARTDAAPLKEMADVR